MSHGFLRNTTIVGLLTLLSRVTGVIRDMVYLISFGAGPLMDAFLVAFKIPNFMRRLTAEGAFSQAFVPVISEYKVQKSHAEVRELVAGVTGVFGLVLFAITLVGVVAAPVLTFLFAPGWHDGDGRFELTVEMLRFTFPYMFFISLVALGSGILNSYGRFAVPALNQTLLNLVMIVAAGVVAPYFEKPGLVLAIGVFVAGVVQLVAQFPALHALGLLPRPRFDRAREGVRRIGRLMLPGIFGSSVAQVSLLLDTVIASFLVVGSVTWLYSADRLVEFPMGVFSIALATVILPGLSSHHSEKSPEKFNATLDWALRLTTTVVVPAAVGLLMLSGPLIATIFGYGAFTDRDVLMCGYALMAYSFGLIGFSLVKVLAPGLLRAPGHEDAGEDRPDRALVQHGLQPVRRRAGVPHGFPGAARAARRLDGPVGDHQFDAAVPRACAGTASTGRRRRGESCCRRSHWRASPWPPSCGGFRGTGRPGPAGRQHGAPPGSASPSSAGALVYFGVLALCRPAPQGPEASIIAGHEFPIRQGHADSTWFRTLS